MGFGGGGSKPAPEPPRTKPEEGTYAPREEYDPVNTQLGLNPEGQSLLNEKPKPKPQSMIG